MPGSSQSWRTVRVGKVGSCLVCLRAAQKRWVAAHPENVQAARKRYRSSPKGQDKAERDRKHLRAINATQDGKDQRQRYNSQYALTEKGRNSRRSGTLRYLASAKGLDTRHSWVLNHPDKVSRYRKRSAARIRAIPELHLRKIIRQAFHNRMKSLSSVGKVKPTRDYDVDFTAIYEHLGPRPGPDYWVDHIVPVTYFDHDDLEQIRICWHFANLRWVPRDENLRKGASLPATWPENLPYIQGTGPGAGPIEVHHVA